MNVSRMQKHKVLVKNSPNSLLTKKQVMRMFGVMAKDLNVRLKLTVGEWA